MRLLFVDSWGWIALANKNEVVYPLVRSIYDEESKAGCRLVTSDYILDEVITFLFSKLAPNLATRFLKPLLAAAETQLERINQERFNKAWKLRLQYQDKPKISFTDFTSFVVMQELGIKRVLTMDHHFEQVGMGFTRLPGSN